MNCGIYCITNLKNGKRYVGQSINIKTRWSAHRCQYLRNLKYIIGRAIAKHGLENFSFEVLEYCSEEMLDDRERYYIAEYKTMYNQNGYNLEHGGKKGRVSEWASISKMGKRNPLFGKKLSLERRRLMSERGRGQNNKLLVDEVANIKIMLLEGLSQTLIASRSGVGIDTINKIAKGKNWSWVLPGLLDRLSDEQTMRDNRIREAWERGLSTEAICREVGCGRRLADRVLGTSRHKEANARDELMVIDFNSGMTRDEIQAKYKVKRSVVNNALHEATQERSKALYDEWLRLRNGGMKVQDIAKQYGVHRTTVSDNTRGFYTK